MNRHIAVQLNDGRRPVLLQGSPYLFHRIKRRRCRWQVKHLDVVSVQQGIQLLVEDVAGMVVSYQDRLLAFEIPMLYQMIEESKNGLTIGTFSNLVTEFFALVGDSAQYGELMTLCRSNTNFNWIVFLHPYSSPMIPETDRSLIKVNYLCIMSYMLKEVHNELLLLLEALNIVVLRGDDVLGLRPTNTMPLVQGAELPIAPHDSSLLVNQHAPMFQIE